MLTVILSLLLLGSSPNPAIADAEQQEAPPKVEETILVTATRSERALNQLPMSATVVTEERLETAPVRSIDDLLRGIAGVQPSIVSSSGSTPTNQRFTMHGLGGTRALVLVDGIPLHDAYSGLVQWQRVPLDTLRQIEVVRGGNASLFGTFALGGTINLITRPAERDLVAVDVSYGSFETTRAAVRVEHVITPDLAIRLTHHKIDSAGFDRVPFTGPVDVPAWVDSGITALRADYSLAEASRMFLSAAFNEIDVSQGTPLSYSKRDGFDGSGGFDHASATRGYFAAKVFHQRQDERLVNASIIGNRESEFLSQDALIPSRSTGGSVEWSYVRPGAIRFLSLGGDIRQVEASESRATFNRSGVNTQRNRLSGTQSFTGILGQVGWHPADRVEILTSARFDLYRNEDGIDSIEGGATTVYPETSSRQLDPRVSIRYATGSHSTLRASAYRAFNAPTLRDLYRNNQSGNSVILGNPYLEPETLVGAEAGWEWAGSRGRIEVNFYRNIIEGLQSRAAVAGRPPNVTQFVNLGTGRAQGVELTSSLILNRHWSIDASYTHADSIVTEDPNPLLVGKRITEVPRDAGSLSLRYRGARGTVAEMRGRSVGHSFADADNLAKSPAHQVVDLSISQPVRPWLGVYLLAENVFDEMYYQALSGTGAYRSAPPRSITVGIKLRSTFKGRS
ncbi:MAG TPA: TonB-dependent receptor [Thermoanaerobaculia bacterium]